MARRVRQKLTWQESDAKYRARGKARVLQYDPTWNEELEQMNHNKVGRPYKYPHSMLTAIAIFRVMIGASYRATAGELLAQWTGHDVPFFTQIWKRIGGAMPVFEKVSVRDILGKGKHRLIVDSTGIKMSNRGEWIRVRWNVKRGFFKLHILIDLDTKRILAFELSDMNGGDAANLVKLLSTVVEEYAGEGIPMSKSLSDMVLKMESEMPGSQADSCQTLLTQWLPDGEKPAKEKQTKKDELCITIDEKDLSRVDGEISAALRRIRHKLKKAGIQLEMSGDGAYDARAIFSLLAQMGMTPVIRIRVNANTSSKGVDRARTLAALEQLGGKGCTNRAFKRMTKAERRANQKEWKEDIEYGLRWIVEIVISAFKRVLGESVRALKPYTAFVEIATKIAAYNMYLDIDEEAIKSVRGNSAPEQLEFG